STVTGRPAAIRQTQSAAPVPARSIRLETVSPPSISACSPARICATVRTGSALGTGILVPVEAIAVVADADVGMRRHGVHDGPLGPVERVERLRRAAGPLAVIVGCQETPEAAVG